MASFRTHISFGIACGVLSVVLLTSFAVVPSSWSFFVLMWLLVTIGAILPDMDSDSGVPFHVTFGSLSLIVGGFVFLSEQSRTPHEFGSVAIRTILSMVLVWGVVGTLFKRFTKHRGMAHSIPAAVLAGLVVFSFASRVGFDDWKAFLLGVAMTFGYLIHLVLDEVYAAVNFHGTMFLPNKALGSALKLFSEHRGMTILVYGALLFMLVGNSEKLFRLSERFFLIFR